MADMTQVYTALRNAHAAGDTEAAQKLAAYIQNQQAGGQLSAGWQPAQEPSMPAKVMGSAARGIAGLIDMVPSLGAAGYEAMGGKVNPSYFRPGAVTGLVSDALPAHYTGIPGALIEGAAAGGPMGMGRKVLANMALGATSSGAAKTTEEMGGGMLSQLAVGMVAPSAAQGALSRLSGLGKSGFDVMAKPERVAAGVFSESASNKLDLASRLRGAKSETGMPMTSAQALRDPLLAEQEMARRSRSGANYQFVDEQQRAVLADTLAKYAKTPADREALVKLRSETTEPMFETIKGRVLATEDDTLQRLIDRAAGVPLKMAETAARREGRPFRLPVQTELGSKMTLDDLEKYYAERQTHPNAVVGGTPSDMPISQPKDLLGEIRRLGGVAMKDAKDLLGERQITKMGVQGGVFTTKGEEVGDMVRRLVDKGVMPPQVLNDVDGGAQALRDAIQQAAMGGGDDIAMRAAAESYYGAPEVLPSAFKDGAPVRMGENVQNIKPSWSTISGESADYVRKGINKAFDDPNEDARSLMKLKQDYQNFIGNQAPEYMAGVKKFSEMSKPINEIDVGRTLYNKFVPAIADIASKSPAMQGEIMRTNAANLAAALRAKNTASTATGFSGDVMQNYPEILRAGESVVSDAARIAQSRAQGLGMGSPTNRYIAQNRLIGTHIATQAGIPQWAQGIMAKPFVGYTAGLPFKVIDTLIGGAAEKLNLNVGDILDKMHADPKFAAKLIDEAKIPIQQKKQALQFFMNPQPSATIAGSAMQASQQGER